MNRTGGMRSEFKLGWMMPIAGWRASLSKVLIFVITAAVATAWLQAQPRSPEQEKPGQEKPAPIIFNRVGLPFSFAPIAQPLKLPLSIRSQDYSLAYARRNLVPAMGGSIAMGGSDGEALPDFYVTIPGGSNHLLVCDKDGNFVDITEKAKVQGSGADLGAAFGDFDKSGHASLFVAGLGGVTLYRNNGDNTFTDVTAKAGLKGKAGELAASVLLFDADGDGFLDVLVAIYTDLSAPPSKATFLFPNDFHGASSRFYHNNHDGTFTDATESAGLTTNPGRTHVALAADFRQRGCQDLLFLRDDKPPALFRNNGRGEFEDKTWDAGTEIWKYAYVQGQVADFNHDRKPDAVLWSTVGNEVLLNRGNGKFAQDDSLPLVYAANRAFGFHGLTADFEDDGWDDLLTVDVRGAWHFLSNRNGSFAEVFFSFGPERRSGDAFAAMAAVHLGKPQAFRGRRIALIGLTTDGQLEMYREPGNRGGHGSLDEPAKK